MVSEGFPDRLTLEPFGEMLLYRTVEGNVPLRCLQRQAQNIFYCGIF